MKYFKSGKQEKTKTHVILQANTNYLHQWIYLYYLFIKTETRGCWEPHMCITAVCEGSTADMDCLNISDKSLMCDEGVD